MAGRVIFTPGTTWTTNDDVTAAKLNLTANGTYQVLFNTRELDDLSTTVAAEGQMLIYRVATGKWTPENVPVNANPTFSQIFAWEHF